MTRADADSPSPLFAQVRDSLKASIVSGTLAPGAKLPSEAELEQRFGVSRVTVRQALSDLQKQAIIEKVNGKGSFVSALSEATSVRSNDNSARRSGSTVSSLPETSSDCSDDKSAMQ